MTCTWCYTALDGAYSPAPCLQLESAPATEGHQPSRLQGRPEVHGAPARQLNKPGFHRTMVRASEPVLSIFRRLDRRAERADGCPDQ